MNYHNHPLVGMRGSECQLHPPAIQKLEKQAIKCVPNGAIPNARRASSWELNRTVAGTAGEGEEKKSSSRINSSSSRKPMKLSIGAARWDYLVIPMRDRPAGSARTRRTVISTRGSLTGCSKSGVLPVNP